MKRFDLYGYEYGNYSETEVVTYPLKFNGFKFDGKELSATPFRIQFAMPGHEFDRNMRHYYPKSDENDAGVLENMIYIVCFYTSMGENL